MSVVGRLHDLGVVFVLGALAGGGATLVWTTTRAGRSEVDVVAPPTVSTEKSTEVRFLRRTTLGVVVEDRDQNYWLYRGDSLPHDRFTPVAQRWLDKAPAKAVLEATEHGSPRPVFRLLRKPTSDELFFVG